MSEKRTGAPRPTEKRTGAPRPSVLGGDKGGGGRPPARPGGNPENRGPSTGSTGPKINTKK